MLRVAGEQLHDQVQRVSVALVEQRLEVFVVALDLDVHLAPLRQRLELGPLFRRRQAQHREDRTDLRFFGLSHEQRLAD